MTALPGVVAFASVPVLPRVARRFPCRLKKAGQAQVSSGGLPPSLARSRGGSGSPQVGSPLSLFPSRWLPQASAPRS